MLYSISASSVEKLFWLFHLSLSLINQIFRLKSDAEGTTLLDIEASYNKNNFVLKSYTNVKKMKFDVMLKVTTQFGKCTLIIFLVKSNHVFKVPSINRLISE